MDSKITRRVAIGSAIGLVAGTVGTIYFRSSRSPIVDKVKPEKAEIKVNPKAPESEKVVVKESGPYGIIDIPPSEFDSDLPPEEIKKALEILYKERKMWINFKGITGKIKVVKETDFEDKKESQIVTDEGFISLSLDLKASAGRGRKMLLPNNIKLVYSDTENGTPVWTFSMANRNTPNPGNFTGKNIESISHTELYTLLTLPLSLLFIDNDSINQIISYWNISHNDKSSTEPDSYVFGSNGKAISDGLLPSYGFTNGHFSDFIPKRKPGLPFPLITFADPIVDNGIAFPTTISILNDDKNKTSPEFSSTTITLSNIHITTT